MKPSTSVLYAYLKHLRLYCSPVFINSISLTKLMSELVNM
jgi:hypothetical protein